MKPIHDYLSPICGTNVLTISLKRNTFSGVFVSNDKPNTLSFKIIVQKIGTLKKLSQINPDI